MNATTLDSNRVVIAKAKNKAKEWMPYLYSVFGPMRCIATEKVPTAAVDKHGRMYYNPEFFSKLSVEVIAYVILHETLHVVLSHHQRTQRMIPDMTQQKAYLANIAQDLCIQQTLAREVGQFEPQGIVTLQAMTNIPGIFANRTSEQYYEALLAYQQTLPPPPNTPVKPPDCDDDGEGDDDDDDEDTYDTGHDYDDDEDYDQDDAEFGDGDEDEDEFDSDSDDGESDDSDHGDGPRGGESEGDGESDSDSEGSGSGEPSNQQGGGEGGGDSTLDTTGLPEFGEICNPADAGSNSDGIEKEWEEEPNIAEIAASEQRLREVEKALEELNPQIGSGAGNIRQALKARLHPLPDPFDQLKQAVARSIASPVGTPELTYRKWPRRNLPGKARLHGVERFQPEATILLDTSGSMDDCKVKQKALAIVAKGISRLQNPRIVCCDGAIQSARRVANMNHFKWDGGGGTDMANGLIYVDQKYQPDAIVIITDGITAWPSKPLRARVIVALCRGDYADYVKRIPKWMKVVHLYKKGEPYVL